MNDRTNTLGNWACLAVAVIVFGLLMGLRTELHSEWLRAVAAGVAFVVLFTTMNHLRKSKPDGGTQQGASPNGDPAKPHGDPGATEGPPSVS